MLKEYQWNSRAVRFGGCIHERLKEFHCAWVPACAWVLLTDSIGYAEGGWRVVTSMRSVADLRVSRSCNETHWYRSVVGTFPPAASLSHLCRRLMPIVLRRPAPMELAELVSGATVKRRLRSKQTIQRRLTKKQPLFGNSLLQSSDPATEAVPDVEEHPIVLERTEPWRPLTENEKNAWNALSPEEKEVCNALSTGCIENLGMGIQTSGAWWTVCVKIVLIQQCWRPRNSCTARPARIVPQCYLVLVTSGQVMEPGAVLQMYNFYLKHPLKEVHVKGTLLVDASSRAAVIRIWRTAPRQELLGNVSASEARQMLQESWFKFYGRPETVMTDPEGWFRERLFREWLASKNVKWDPQLAEAVWRIGILDKVLDVLKNAATRAARRAPEDTSCEALFDDCTEAHNELHRQRGYSPFQLLIGRSPLGLPLDGDKQLVEVSASLTSDCRHRLHTQRECYRAYLDEEMSLQQKRREMHKSRPFRVRSSGEWCWFWRSSAHLHRRTKASRQFKEGAFLGPERVLLQERERKGNDLKYKAVVWVVDGDQLVRCSSTHLRPVSTAEQTLWSLRDGEAQTSQQVVQELPNRNFVDLVGQPSPVEEDFEEPMNVATSDNELHEDFFSGEEFASAPDIQRCQKIRR